MYAFKRIEKKWQSKWNLSSEYISKENKKKKFYLLEMIPYPSGYGLHMGHARNYIIGDVLARYKRMKGFNVLHPMGYDSFGLPAENAAIKEGIHPKKYTEDSIRNFIRQQKSLGLSYDWSRMIKTHSKEYYKWDQWLFLQFLKKDIAYRKKALVNFCSKCNTVLANEQVVQGKCWRHPDNDVEIKDLEQWFFRTARYASELLKDIDGLEWPKAIKDMQKNWIGKSAGTLVYFRLRDKDEFLEVFTTRPDTLYGVTFIAFAPEHPKVLDIVKGTEYEKKVKDFIKNTLLNNKYDREGNKEGMFIGKYAIHPLTKEEIPIYIVDFVLLEYGTGIVMSVPAHDQRDYDFAIKHDLKIKQVIEGSIKNCAYVGEGRLINSRIFDGISNNEAVERINDYLEQNKLGKRTEQYRLRDWLISRQRYWGCPIPVIYCEKCGIVPDENLPVTLPEKVNFKSGGNPLATSKSFVNVKCPKCKSKARRETDTMDTFVDSSWYFLRYCDPKNDRRIFDDKKANYWMPIDFYIGGREHATGHLIYFRFFTKVFRDFGLLNFDEPALRLYNQGDVNKNGIRMSKSKGNVVDPTDVIKDYGADSLRFYLMFISSPDSVLEWDDSGIKSSYNFLNKIYSIKSINYESSQKDRIVQSKINTLIGKVTQDIENMEFNKALISIMEFTNYFYRNCSLVSRKVYDYVYKRLLALLHPFIPHMTSELKCLKEWPESDKNLIDKRIEFTEEFIQKTIEDIHEIIKLTKINPKKINLFISDQWKYELLGNLKGEESRDFDYLIRKYMIKEHSKDVVSIIKSVLKNPKRIPDVLLSQNEEYDILNEHKYLVEKEFDVEIILMKGNEKAYPGKVAIILE